MNRFRGRGNLGADPVLRHVDRDGEPRAVCSMRIYFDRRVPESIGSDQFVDRGGFWLNVSLWGKRGEAAARLLCKGARVAAGGSLIGRMWTSKESGEERSAIELQADYVDVDISRIERIVWQPKGDSARENDDREGFTDEQV